MEISINIPKKNLFLISAMIIFLVGFGLIFAYGGDNPSNMGHSVGEINWEEPISQICLTGNKCIQSWAEVDTSCTIQGSTITCPTGQLTSPTCPICDICPTCPKLGRRVYLCNPNCNEGCTPNDLTYYNSCFGVKSVAHGTESTPYANTQIGYISPI